MKSNAILLAVLILSMFFSYGQNFEGKAIYSNHFVSKIKNFTDEQLGSMIGTKQEYFIKEGNYKSILNGQSITTQIYDYKSNRMYNKKNNSDTLYWFDASVNTDEVISYEIKKSADLLLGNRCDAIIMKTKTGTTTIYYTALYKVDSKVYANHHYSNWAFYTLKTGALPLKIIVETPQFKMESTVIEITPMRLGDDFFKIDPKTPTKKSG